MPRRRVLWLVILGLVIVLGAGTLVALPEVMRRVAVDRLARQSGRAVAIDDIDLNPFTGRLAIKGFRLAQRDGREAALEAERLEIVLGYLGLFVGDARLQEVTLVAPRIRATRLGPAEFDFSDLLALVPPPDPSKPKAPSSWTVSVGRVVLTGGAIVARDQAVSPEREWRLEALTIDGADLSTRQGAGTGRLRVTATLNGTPLELSAERIDLGAPALAARASVQGLDLAGIAPYVPAGIDALPAGRLSAALSATVGPGTAGTPRALTASGEVTLEQIALRRREGQEPFLRLGRLAVTIQECDPLALAATLGRVEVEGLDLRAVRDAQGRIDLLALAGRTASTGAPAPVAAAGPPAVPVTKTAAATQPAAPAEAGGPRVRIQEVALRGGTFTLRDEAVAPANTLALSDLALTVRDLTWPSAGPAALEAALNLPGAGRLTVKGRATLQPITADFTMSMRGAAIDPYHPYIPIRARFGGSYNGDSVNQVEIRDGRVLAASRGRSWIDKLEIRAPDDPRPPVALERITLEGIDFAWPRHARVATFTLKRPAVRIERGADGVMNLRRLFAVAAPSGAAAPAPAPPAPTPAAAPAGVPAAPEPGAPRGAGAAAQAVVGGATAAAARLPLTVEVGAFVIDDGTLRFLDRTVTPAFAQTIAPLALRIEGLSSRPGHRAKLSAQAIVGKDAAFDLRGEVSPLGERLFVDLAGELKQFQLPTVNPYVDNMIAWVIREGTLAFKVHYTVDGDQLTARNDIVVGGLKVEKTRDEEKVKRALGLPLGLVVALVKDGDGNIKVPVPINGSLSDPKFSLGEAIWTAVKNVVVNILKAPFRAIGRLFTSEDNTIQELTVEPVTFPAGSAVVVPAMERHLTSVADFLRRSPYVNLTLAPITAPRDETALRELTLNERLVRVQRERGLPDLAAAVAAEFRKKFPEEKTPPPVPEQRARLVEAEPLAGERLPELATRRLTAVREALVSLEGIPDTRLRRGDAVSATNPTAEGRVEFRFAD